MSRKSKKSKLNLKRATLPMPIRESLDYLHSWNKKKKETPEEKKKREFQYKKSYKRYADPDVLTAVFEARDSGIYDYEGIRNYVQQQTGIKLLLEEWKTLQYQYIANRLNLRKIADYDQTTTQTSDISDEVKNRIKEIQKNIPEEDLYKGQDEEGWVKDGKQTLLHMTVLYGVEDEDIPEIKEIFQKHDKLEIEIDKIHYFDQDDYTVAVLRCKSDAIRELHGKLKRKLEVKEDYATYKPHITIAYLQPGKRLEDEEFPNIKWEIDTIEVSKSNGKLEKIKKDSSRLNLKKAQEDKFNDDEPYYEIEDSESINGYDFGGAALPHRKGITIVDTEPEEYFRGLGYKDSYIQQDINTENFTLPEQKPFINVSAVIRYAGITNNALDQSKLKNIAMNIDKSLTPGGTVRLLDFESVLKPVVEYLKSFGYDVENYEQYNWYEKGEGIFDDMAEFDAVAELRKSGEQIRSSILDEPRNTLDTKIWDIAGDEPKLRPEIKEEILNRFFSYLCNYGGYNKPESFVKDIYYTGSTATRRYHSSSDADIHIIVDWNKMIELNPEKKNTPQTMWRELHDTFWWTLNKETLPGTKHPLTYFVMPPGKNNILETTEEAYNLRTDKWIIKPDRDEISGFEALEHVKDEADEIMSRIELEVANVKKGIIDYILLKDILGDYKDDGEELRHKIKDKLTEIEESLMSLKDEREHLKQRRNDGFKYEEPIVEGLSKNWTPSNILYKAIERYKYMNILKDIEKILKEKEDQQLTERDIPEVMNAMAPKFEKKLNLKKTATFKLDETFWFTELKKSIESITRISEEFPHGDISYDLRVANDCIQQLEPLIEGRNTFSNKKKTAQRATTYSAELLSEMTKNLDRISANYTAGGIEAVINYLHPEETAAGETEPQQYHIIVEPIREPKSEIPWGPEGPPPGIIAKKLNLKADLHDAPAGGTSGQGGLGATPEDWAWGYIPGEGDGIPDSKLKRTNPKRYDQTRQWQGDTLDDSTQKTPSTLKSNKLNLKKTAQALGPDIVVALFRAIDDGTNINNYEETKQYIFKTTGVPLAKEQWSQFINKHLASNINLKKKSTVDPRILPALREANMLGMNFEKARQYISKETGVEIFPREWDEAQRRHVAKTAAIDPFFEHEAKWEHEPAPYTYLGMQENPIGPPYMLINCELCQSTIMPTLEEVAPYLNRVEGVPPEIMQQIQSISKRAYDYPDMPDVQKTYDPYVNALHNSILEQTGESATEGVPTIAPTGNPTRPSGVKDNTKQDPWGRQPDVNILKKRKPTPEQIPPDFNEAPGHGGGEIRQSSIEDKLTKKATQLLKNIKKTNKAFDDSNVDDFLSSE